MRTTTRPARDRRLPAAAPRRSPRLSCQPQCAQVLDLLCFDRKHCRPFLQCCVLADLRLKRNNQRLAARFFVSLKSCVIHHSSSLARLKRTIATPAGYDSNQLQVGRRLSSTVRHDLEADGLALAQIPDAGALDSGDMQEYVLGSSVRLNKAEPLLNAEPFDFPDRHSETSKKENAALCDGRTSFETDEAESARDEQKDRSNPCRVESRTMDPFSSVCNASCADLPAYRPLAKPVSLPGAWAHDVARRNGDIALF